MNFFDRRSLANFGSSARTRRGSSLIVTMVLIPIALIAGLQTMEHAQNAERATRRELLRAQAGALADAALARLAQMDAQSRAGAAGAALFSGELKSAGRYEARVLKIESGVRVIAATGFCADAWLAARCDLTLRAEGAKLALIERSFTLDNAKQGNAQ